MNAQKLTQKALEAIQTAQNIAIENQNIQILPEHLFYALLDGEDGLVNNLFRKMGKNPDALLAETDTLIRKLPAVSGSGREPDKVYISPLTDKILTAAEKLAAGMKDDYVSVEHIMLCIFDYAEGALKDIFRAHGITKDGFLKELKKVKTDRITSDNPETTYDALQQARPRYRPRRRNPQRHKNPFPQNKKQPRTHRRAGRGQNGDCRRSRAENSTRRRSRRAERQNNFRVGYGCAYCGSQIQRRV